MKLALSLALVGLLLVGTAMARCPNGCSGHGTCSSSGTTSTDQRNDICTCHKRVEQSTRHTKETSHPETFMWTGYDCSRRTCPYGYSHASEPAGDFSKVNSATDRAVQDGHDWKECSNAGSCDRDTGACQCQAGFSGSACEIRIVTDPSVQQCSGHGVLKTQKELHESAYDYYSSVSVASLASSCTSGLCMTHEYTSAWDAHSVLTCECDSGFYGPNCEFMTCPSKVDPNGGPGSSQGRVCSGRGTCDTSTGTCACYSGFYGTACESITALV